MAQRNCWERGANAHFSLGFFSFFRGGGTGASAPPAPSFFTTFFTTFFLGVSAGAAGVVGTAGVPVATLALGGAGVDSVFSVIDDSIWAAVDAFPFPDFTPICARDTAATGGVGTCGSSAARRVSSGGAGGSAAAGEGAVTVGVRSSLAMMD